MYPADMPLLLAVEFICGAAGALVVRWFCLGLRLGLVATAVVGMRHACQRKRGRQAGNQGQATDGHVGHFQENTESYAPGQPKPRGDAVILGSRR